MQFEVAVLGAGAAGMMCAAQAGQAGLRVVLIDHAEKLAEKIRISGGGRCNFTNREVNTQHFVSNHPEFSKKALAAYQPSHFIDLMKQHGLSYTEKHKGQLFCDQKSQAIIDMLAKECQIAGVHWLKPCEIQSVQGAQPDFQLHTSKGLIRARNVVIATGGLPIPKIGASDFGLRLAKQYGHKLVDTAPALVPLVFSSDQWASYSALSGLAVAGRVRGSEPKAPWFEEDLLFTHRGLSGPGVLQASSFWRPGQAIEVNLSNRERAEEFSSHLLHAAVGTKSKVSNWISEQLPHWPKRLIELTLSAPEIKPLADRKVAELGKKSIRPLVSAIAQWRLFPTGTAGYAKAEVMRGGVCTSGLEPGSMQSKQVPGLYFIGEVVDMTGWLGGYNFQWAWASGVSAARQLARQTR